MSGNERRVAPQGVDVQDNEELAYAEAVDGLPRYELRDLFGEEVTDRLHLLWRRIAEGGYSTNAERDLLLDELLKYHQVVHTKFLSAYRQSVWHSCSKNNASGGGMIENDEEFNVPLPYSESKRFSEWFRALFWQFALELTSFIADLLFLQTLGAAEETFDLFIASAVLLVVAALCRLWSAYYIRKLVDWNSRACLYILGVIVNLFETNLGLAIMKQSLKTEDPNGEVERYTLGGKVAKRRSKDPIVVLARNSAETGRIELRNILSVTLGEDIPQFVIQLVYFTRVGLNADEFALLAFATTGLHILFQWVEAYINFRWIFKVLQKIWDGREGYHDTIIKKKKEGLDAACATLLPCVDKRTGPYNVQLFAAKYADKVRVFDLSDFKEELGDSDMEVLAENCPNLVRVRIFGCSLVTDEGVIALAHGCKNLNVVGFGNCTKITNKGLIEIAQNCQYLVGAYLSNTQVTDEGIEQLALLCPLLNHLYVSGCKGVTDVGITALAENCGEMRILSVHSCTGVTDEGIVKLARNCTRLRQVFFRDNVITDKSLEALAEDCKELETIMLYRCKQVTSSGVTELALNCRRLTEVSCSFCDGVTDDFLVALGENCKRLTRCSVRATLVTDRGLEYVVKSCKDLNNLVVSECEGITDEGLFHIGRNCRSLERLDLRGCVEITDEGLDGLAPACEGITDLDLGGCASVTDQGIIALSASCKNLHRINLENCPKVSEQGIVALVDGCKYLTRITVTGLDSERLNELRNKGILVVKE